jgi:hypothetical protein
MSRMASGKRAHNRAAAVCLRQNGPPVFSIMFRNQRAHRIGGGSRVGLVIAERI